MFTANAAIASKLTNQTNHKFPIIYSERFLEHDTGTYHPEKAGRLIAIVQTLKNSAIAQQLVWHEPSMRSDILQEVRRFIRKNILKPYRI